MEENHKNGAVEDEVKGLFIPPRRVTVKKVLTLLGRGPTLSPWPVSIPTIRDGVPSWPGGCCFV